MSGLSLEQQFNLAELNKAIGRMSVQQARQQLTSLTNHFNVQQQCFLELIGLECTPKPISYNIESLPSWQLRQELKDLIVRIFEQENKYRDLVKTEWGLTPLQSQ